jgi:hypothetical protein
MKIRKWLCLLLSAAMLLCMVPSLAEEAPEAPAAEEEPIIVNVIDYFTQAGLGLYLTPYRGKAIALHFFSADSAGCQTMLPTWKMLLDDFDKEALQIVFICACKEDHSEEACPAAEPVKEAFGEEAVCIFEDKDAFLCTTLGVEKMPNTLILNQDGNPACGYEGLLTYPTFADWFTTLNVEQLQDSYSPAAE